MVLSCRGLCRFRRFANGRSGVRRRWANEQAILANRETVTIGFSGRTARSHEVRLALDPAQMSQRMMLERFRKI